MIARIKAFFQLVLWSIAILLVTVFVLPVAWVISLFGGKDKKK